MCGCAHCPSHRCKKEPTVGKILFHTLLVLITGGLWLLVLLVRALVK